MLEDALLSFELNGKSISATTDSAAVMKATINRLISHAEEEGGFMEPWLPCAAYKIQLCTNNLILSMGQVKQLVQQAELLTTNLRTLLGNSALKKQPKRLAVHF